MGRRYNNDSVLFTTVGVSRTRNELIRIAFEGNAVGNSNIHTSNCRIEMIYTTIVILSNSRVNLLSVTLPCCQIYVHLRISFSCMREHLEQQRPFLNELRFNQFPAKDFPCQCTSLTGLHSSTSTLNSLILILFVRRNVSLPAPLDPLISLIVQGQ